MKVNLFHTVNYFDTDATGRANLSFLYQQLQNAAVKHTEAAGYRMDSLIRNGQGWVLQKMDMQIRRYPEYREAVDINTWSTSIQGVKAKREFLVCSNQEKLISASSIWLFVDSIRMKIIRTPEGMEDRYTIHEETAWNADLERWKARQDIRLSSAETISIRHSDYDAMGHVNNTAYIDFLETAVNRRIGEGLRISELRIQYLKELDPSIVETTVGFQKSEDRYLFTIRSEQTVHAAGEIKLQEA